MYANFFLIGEIGIYHKKMQTPMQNQETLTVFQIRETTSLKESGRGELADLTFEGKRL